MDEGQIREKYGITGCEHCPYFVEVDKPWRQYCGKDNFNINRASYTVTKTSHNKNKEVIEANYEWDYAFPKRCPLRKEKP